MLVVLLSTFMQTTMQILTLQMYIWKMKIKTTKIDSSNTS